MCLCLPPHLSVSRIPDQTYHFHEAALDLSLSVTHTHTLSFYLFVSLSVCLCACVSPPISQYHEYPTRRTTFMRPAWTSLSLSLSHTHTHYLFACLSVCLSACVSLLPPPPPPHLSVSRIPDQTYHLHEAALDLSHSVDRLELWVGVSLLEL